VSTSTYYLEIKSDLALLPKVDKFIKKAVKNIGLDQNDIDGLLLSVNEAVSNAIIHGNNYNPDKKVIISIIQTSDELVISIKDQGKGFNPSQVPDPTSPENILKENGRGIHIIKMCVQDIHYNFTPDGTELILTIKSKKAC
jgi:serine/threonine-protein kinase RsbW